jgi:MarR family transcriptional regulator, organic hydroperoxide resistance regulator
VKSSLDSSRAQKTRDREVAGRFLELLGAMKRYVREQLPSSAGSGMSEERFRTLVTLKFYGRGYLKTLAMHDGLSSSALCIMLNHMVEEGLAARTEDQDDRRNVSYELTAAGAARLSAELERRTDLIGGALDRMGTAEKSRFASAIEAVISGIGRLTNAQ